MNKFKTNYSKNKKNRKTIGFIINDLHHRYQGMICPGIIDGAIKRDYNLIAFVGKSLNSPSVFENQENAVYELACEKNLDGLLILSGAIGNNLSINELKAFCYKYKPLPLVCVATPIDGIPSVWVDNRSGMREIVSHFVKDHHYKQIAYIRGPAKNPEAELRYQVFKEVLNENNIPLIPDLIYEGNFIWNSGVEGVKTFLDKRKMKFDALLAGSDEILIGVYRELVHRGFKIPEEVALGGFDNIDETRIITPQLTTVYQPLYEEGMKGLELLADSIEGKSVPELYTFPARLIIRQSCGCKMTHHMDYKKKKAHYKEHNDIKISGERQKIILEQLLGDTELQSDTPKDFIECKDLIEVYLNAFIEDLENKNNKNFLKEIIKLTKNFRGNNCNLEFFKILVLKIYQYILPFLADSREQTSIAGDLYNSALSILSDSLSRHYQYIIDHSKDSNLSMLNVTKTLSTTFNLERLRDIILNLLPTLDISFCFIALYNTHNKSQSIPAPESSVFLHFQKNNQEQNYKNGFVYDSYQLIPDILINKSKRFSLVIFPLVTENDHFGFIALNYDSNIDPVMYETLQGHISASLNGAAFLETVKQQSEDLFIQKDNLKTLRRVLGGFINSMSFLVEVWDPYTAGHQIRVANLARTIATEFGLSKDQIEGIRVSSVLHDLGKLYIPSQLLNKPGRLMEVEFNLIKIHPQIGYNVLKSVDFPWPVADIILQHHERIDGSGYPAGLKADEIMIEAQIICIADVVEAMASHRPYRPALGIDAALEEIKKNSGKLYNPALVECCIRIFKEKGFKFDAPFNTFKYGENI